MSKKMSKSNHLYLENDENILFLDDITDGL